VKHSSYSRHQFPAEIISHAVWLYHVFSLSLRDVELILAERGVVATHVVPEVRRRLRREIAPTPAAAKSPGQAQRFLSTHAMIHGHFRLRRLRLVRVQGGSIAESAGLSHRTVSAITSPARLLASSMPDR
jgi:transposase-like protein